MLVRREAERDVVADRADLDARHDEGARGQHARLPGHLARRRGGDGLYGCGRSSTGAVAGSAEAPGLAGWPSTGRQLRLARKRLPEAFSSRRLRASLVGLVAPLSRQRHDERDHRDAHEEPGERDGRKKPTPPRLGRGGAVGDRRPQASEDALHRVSCGDETPRGRKGVHFDVALDGRSRRGGSRRVLRGAFGVGTGRRPRLEALRGLESLEGLEHVLRWGRHSVGRIGRHRCRGRSRELVRLRVGRHRVRDGGGHRGTQSRLRRGQRHRLAVEHRRGGGPRQLREARGGPGGRGSRRPLRRAAPPRWVPPRAVRAAPAARPWDRRRPAKGRRAGGSRSALRARGSWPRSPSRPAREASC